MSCKNFEQSLALYVYGELSGQERTEFEAHLASCEPCRTALEQSKRVDELLAGRALPEPTPDLLVVCRQKLEDALDREELGWRALIRNWLPPLATAHPARAVSALTLVVFGFSLGWILRPRVATVSTLPPTGIAPAQMTGGSDLGGARINSISQVAPDPETGQVKITLNAERRVTMEGSLDDPRIRQVLVYAMKSYGNPGIRMDTLNALRQGSQGSNDPAVLGALVYALRHDANAGVRLEALRALRQTPWDEGVQQALAAAAQADANLGVRDEAINGLVERAVSAQDESLIPTLRQLASADSDRYVRIRSLAALRQMGQEP